MKRRPAIPMGIAATAALAFLTFGAAFVATVGPRAELAAQTTALRHTLAAAPRTARAITVSGPWDEISNALSTASPGSQAARFLTSSQLAEITSQLHADYDHPIVHLAPAAQDWASLTTSVRPVLNRLPAARGVPVDLEVSCRQPFSDRMRLLAGALPAPRPAARARQAPVVEVVVTSRTAAAFGLHPGSDLRISGLAPGSAPGSAAEDTVTLLVTGIVAPRKPSSTFWAADPTVLVPDLQAIPTPFGPQSIWYAGVLTGPAELAAVQRYLGLDSMTAQWELPLAIGRPTGDQAQPLRAALTRLGIQSPPLAGGLAPLSALLRAGSALLPAITGFVATAREVNSLLWLLAVSLVVAAAAVLVLTARMIAMRRAAELAVRRARGASLAQLAATTAGAAGAACVPSAVAGAALGVLVSAGPEPAGGWWPPAAVLVIAVCAPAMLAAWQHRLPRRRAAAGGQRRLRALTRLVAEAAAVAAAAGGIVVLRHQAAPAGGPGLNLYTSAAPVLIAIPVVIVMLRIYPFLLRALLRGSARSPGATAFLGLARAARTALTPVLPSLALVLALTVAAFAGMVRDAVTAGETAASWRAAGADVTITAAAQAPSGSGLPAATLSAASALPGVTRAAQVWRGTWVTAGGQPVTALAVEPAAYAALTAAAPGFPPVRAGLLTAGRRAGAPLPVLASPQAAAVLGTGPETISALIPVRPLRVRVAGVVASTPALPAGGVFVIMPRSALRSAAAPIAPVPVNELLLLGTSIDRARLTTLLRDTAPTAVTTFRSDILSGLTGAPLQRGAFALLTLATAAAAGLGLAVMLLELALGAAERDAALARLAAMGLSAGQRARVVALEVLPAIIAAAVAAWACALVLPAVVAPAVNLSVFTGSSVAVPLVPDVASVALPLAGLAAGAAVSLGIEIRSLRRRRVTASLRVDG